MQVIAGAGGNGLYDFADPDGPDWGDWCAAWSRRFSFVEYSVEAGRLGATAYGWADPQAELVDEHGTVVRNLAEDCTRH